MRRSWHVAGTGNERNACRFSKGTTETKGQPGRLIRNWEVNVKRSILENCVRVVD
jgi:hypothetical protein